MFILTILLFIFILGVIVLIHEVGHFVWAKKFGVHIYEFSLGMGPVLYTKKGKDKINYRIRAFPIGGFVQMAGEVYEDDEKVLPKNFMCNKPWYQRFIVLVAGVVNNFLLALLLLFFYALIWGAPVIETKIGKVLADYPIAEAGIKPGDKIIRINDYKTSTWDEAQLVLYYKNDKNYYEFVIEHPNGKIEEYRITPKKVVDKTTKKEKVMFGFSMDQTKQKGFVASLKYAFQKFTSIYKTMALTIKGLFTGKISLSSLSGPLGIYQVVDESARYGLANIMYLIAFLSINVGFINILPFPAFDGGRVLFMIIEKIKGSPVNSKIENAFHTVGFILLLILMVYVTFQDILRLF